MSSTLYKTSKFMSFSSKDNRRIAVVIRKIFFSIRGEHSTTKDALEYLDYFIIYVLKDYLKSANRVAEERRGNRITSEDTINALKDLHHQVHDEDALFERFNLVVGSNPLETALPKMPRSLMKSLSSETPHPLTPSANKFIRVYIEHLIIDILNSAVTLADERGTLRIGIADIGESIDDQ